MLQRDQTLAQQIGVVGLMGVGHNTCRVTNRMEARHSPGEIADVAIVMLEGRARVSGKQKQRDGDIDNGVAEMHVAPIDHSGEFAIVIDD